MTSAAEEDTQRVDSMRKKALVLEEMMQQASGTKNSSEGEVGRFNPIYLLTLDSIDMYYYIRNTSYYLTDRFILVF